MVWYSTYGMVWQWYGIGVYKNKNSGFCFVLICELRFVGDGQKNIERCQVCKANPGTN